MSITFNGQALSNPSPYEDDAGVQTKETTLNSGKTYVSASTETSFKPSFTCYTETATEITNLLSYVGSPYTLVIDSTSYTNCYISLFKKKQYAPGKYRYNIAFIRHTA